MAVQIGENSQTISIFDDQIGKNSQTISIFDDQIGRNGMELFKCQSKSIYLAIEF